MKNNMFLILMIVMVLINVSFINATEEIIEQNLGEESSIHCGTPIQSFTVGTTGNNTFFNVTKIVYYGYNSNWDDPDKKCITTVEIKSSLYGGILTANYTARVTNRGDVINLPPATLHPSKKYYIYFSQINCTMNFIDYTGLSIHDYVGGDAYYKTYDNSYEKYWDTMDVSFKLIGEKIPITSSPNVILVSPNNNTKVYSLNQILSVYLSNLINNTNVTFYIWKNKILNITKYVNISEIIGYKNILYNPIDYGSYEWNSYLCDNSSKCVFGLGNYTFNYTRYNENCVPKDCTNLLAEGKSCGKWSDGCNSTLDCGVCADPNITNNHLIISSCDQTCSNCDNYTINNNYITVQNLVYQSWNKTINYLGGQNYLESLDYPYPDLNVSVSCSYANQFHTPSYINVAFYDIYGQPHEMIHHVLRHYSIPTGSFYTLFEEGFTNRISYCMSNTNDPCCDLNKGECNEETWCDPVKYPGLCNYQAMQAGMIGKTTSELGCDIENCWRWFFKNILTKKNKETMDIIDTYSFLVSYTGNRSKVDNTLKNHFEALGYDLNDYDPYLYNIPSKAYPINVSKPTNIILPIDIIPLPIIADTYPPSIIFNTIDPLIINNSKLNISSYFCDEVQLKNYTFVLWNQTSSVINDSVKKDITGKCNLSEVNLNLSKEGIYYYNFYVCDNSSNCVYNDYNGTINFTIETKIIDSNDNTFLYFYDTQVETPIKVNTTSYIFSRLLNSNGTVNIQIGTSLTYNGLYILNPIGNYLINYNNNSCNTNIKFNNTGIYYIQLIGNANGTNKNLKRTDIFSIEVINDFNYTNITYYNETVNTSISYNYGLKVSSLNESAIISNTKGFNQTIQLEGMLFTFLRLPNGTGMNFLGYNNRYNVTLEPGQYLTIINNPTLKENEKNNITNDLFRIISRNDTESSTNVKIYSKVNVTKGYVSSRLNIYLEDIDCLNINKVYTFAAKSPPGGISTSYTCSNNKFYADLSIDNTINSSILNELDIFYNPNNDLITYNNLTYVGSTRSFRDSNYLAQTFKTESNYDYLIEKIRLDLACVETVCKVSVTIKNSSLLGNTLSEGIINYCNYNKRYYVDMIPYKFEKNTTYSLIINATCNDYGFPSVYTYNSTNYNNGDAYTSGDSGSTWTQQSYDLPFEIYGTYYTDISVCSSSDRSMNQLIIIISSLLLLSFIIVFIYKNGNYQEINVKTIILIIIGIIFGLSIIIEVANNIGNACP